MHNLKALREARLSQLEFELKLSDPDVFVNYRTAKQWALHRLTACAHLYPGDTTSGWHVHVFQEPTGFACSISQHWWSADHCGAVRPTGALAIVQSMLELEAGY